MNKIRSVRELRTAIGIRMKALAKERDKLDELISEADQLRDNIETALADMDHARDSLSELV